MKRREFLVAAAALASSIPRAIAQQSATKKRLAAIVYDVESARIGRSPLATVSLSKNWQRLGYIEGENLIVDRWQYQSGRLDEDCTQKWSRQIPM